MGGADLRSEDTLVAMFPRCAQRCSAVTLIGSVFLQTISIFSIMSIAQHRQGADDMDVLKSCLWLSIRHRAASSLASPFRDTPAQLYSTCFRTVSRQRERSE